MTARWGVAGWGGIATAAVVAAFALAPFQTFELTAAAAYVPVLAGLVILTGFGGQVSLGQGALFGLGAYTAALLISRHAWPFPVAALAAVALSAGAGVLVSLPALRLGGIQLAMVTLTVAVVFVPIVVRLESLSGGTSGIALPQVDAPAWTGLAEDQFVYLTGVVVAALALVVTVAVSRSSLGRSLRAIQASEPAAQVAGVNVAATKAAAFALACGLAGLGGALYAWSVGFVAPESFPLLLSVTVLVGMVVGGASAAGALLGALFVQFTPSLASSVDADLGGVVYGAAVIAVLLVAPEGVAGRVAAIARSVTTNRRSTS